VTVEAGPASRPRPSRPWLRPLLSVLAAVAAIALVVIVAIASGPASSAPVATPATALATNPYLDPGTPLSGPAPRFTLTDQFGRSVSLSSFRGHVVILTFADSVCTTVCPLTTTTMTEAKGLLGAAGDRVQLLGVDANPQATAVRYVRGYSTAHGLAHQWHFLTGSLAQLRRVWRSYHIDVAIQAGQIDHTPALYVIDARGRWAKIYVTQMAYSSLDQQAQILAREVSSLLPGHPALKSVRSYDRIPPISPGTTVRLPRAGGGSVSIGGSGPPRLLVFFATWLTQTTDLGGQLEALTRYESRAAAGRLPGLVAVDEGSVEPSAQALAQFLHGLRAPLSYPVAIDGSGRVADGYAVQDQPWYVLVSHAGEILWYWDVSTQGWLSESALAQHVRAALATPPTVAPPSLREIPRVLAGSPPPLAALHRQAGRLLGSQSALQARLKRLVGYPVVVNAWASWCPPCKKEYPLFASASVRYGRQVAFVGVNYNDPSPGAALNFMRSHPLSYPSYQSSLGGLDALAPVLGLPTTIFINRDGAVTCARTGGYLSQGALDGDIQSCLQ
jgi:cytochrome oxidase Cu insertion factor (SCO1/SenC/PrrC family)/thiol-disulfide isomerase/thioredoxin